MMVKDRLADTFLLRKKYLTETGGQGVLILLVEIAYPVDSFEAAYREIKITLDDVWPIIYSIK